VFHRSLRSKSHPERAHVFQLMSAYSIAGVVGLGYLEEYPGYTTQGESLQELEENLRDIYADATSGQSMAFTAALGRLGMQCNSVAFSIANYCPKAVGSDGLFFLEDLSAAFLDGSNRIVQPALDAQVNQRAMLGGLVVLRFDQAPGNIFIGMRQESQFHAWH